MRIRLLLRFLLAAAGLLCCVTLNAQSQTFDAAVIKFADPALAMKLFPVKGGPGSTDPGRVTYANMSLKQMLNYAWGVGSDRISGPAWLGTQKFDITATYPTATSREQFVLMLRNLLTDRFRMVTHNEMKDVAGFELVTGKGTVKLKPSSPEDVVAAAQPPIGNLLSGTGSDGYPVLAHPGMIYPFLRDSGGKAIHLIARAQTLAALSNILGGMMHGPIVDKTGLLGLYDFTLDFATDAAAPPPEGVEVSAPSIPTALQDQLGLKLEPKKTQIEVLVIDSAQKLPSDN